MREKLVHIDDVILYLEKTISPLDRQLDWDNSGKQLYFGNKEISKVALALDPSAKAIKEAIQEGCGLLLTHHPLFFDDIKSLDFMSKKYEKVLDATINKLSIISYHTPFDVADYNLSHYVASLLGASVDRPVDITGEQILYKFVVYGPIGYEEKIIEAIDGVGAGTIGNYKKCSFITKGIGTFEPQEGTKPFIGEKGKLTRVNEFKLETIVKDSSLKALISAVKNVHPYEEVAYDVYKLENKISYGVGACCHYEKSLSFIQLSQLFKNRLSVTNMRANRYFHDNEIIDKFCVIAGSGASYWNKCKTLGYELLITGDLKHHDAIDAYENGVTIIDLGHFELEKIYFNYIAELLRKGLGIEVVLIKENSPINYMEVK
jgi:dinuclear metal center YbgI/SA1388 family protein